MKPHIDSDDSVFSRARMPGTVGHEGTAGFYQQWIATMTAHSLRSPGYSHHTPFASPTRTQAERPQLANTLESDGESERDCTDDFHNDLYCCISEEDLAFEPADYAPALPLLPRRTRRQGRVTGLMRYAGGKTKLRKPILARLDAMFRALGPLAEYREPFVGAGGVALPFLRDQPGRAAWLNDGDPSLAALWDAVLRNPDGLTMMVTVFPDVLGPDYFYSYRRLLRTIRTPADLGRYDKVWVALAKLALHQISFSGLGTRAGGPMGGRAQRDPDAIGSRFNPDAICANIGKVGKILSAVSLRDGTCTSLPFERLFEAGEAGFYLDPPYYEAGPGLYEFAFTRADHERLFALLREETRPWMLSYDDHPVIRKMYQGWTRIEPVAMNGTIHGANPKVELLISSR